MIPIDCLPVYEDAGFYDLEFASRTLEIPFFRKMALQSRDQGSILEIACGTGRLTFPIAQDGADITGLDISRPMLERARQRSQELGLPIQWFEQDCRDMRLERPYALIFSATNAMQHLLDVESVCAFLQSARQALQVGGRLILDVFNPSLPKLIRPPSEVHLHKTLQDHDGSDITVDVASQYHADTQILHFDLSYLKNSRVIRTKHVNMRVFFPQELLALCHLNGLRIIERFGSYEETPFQADSPKQILICESL